MPIYLTYWYLNKNILGLLPAVALAACVAQPSAAKMYVLNNRSLVFYKDTISMTCRFNFQELLPMYFMFPKINSARQRISYCHSYRYDTWRF